MTDPVNVNDMVAELTKKFDEKFEIQQKQVESLTELVANLVSALKSTGTPSSATPTIATPTIAAPTIAAPTHASTSTTSGAATTTVMPIASKKSFKDICLNLTPFRGHEDSYVAWKAKTKDVMGIEAKDGADEKEKVWAVEKMIVGEAKKYYESKAVSCDTLDRLFETLDQEFDLSKQRAYCVAQMEAVVQQDDQPGLEYLRAKRNSMNRIVNITDADQIAWVRKGAKGPYQDKLVGNLSVKTVADVETMYRDLDEQKLWKRQQQQARPKPDDFLLARERGNASSSVCNNCGGGHETSTCRLPDKKTIKCNGCGKKGHYQRQCWSKSKSKSNAMMPMVEQQQAAVPNNTNAPIVQAALPAPVPARGGASPDQVCMEREQCDILSLSRSLGGGMPSTYALMDGEHCIIGWDSGASFSGISYAKFMRLGEKLKAKLDVTAKRTFRSASGEDTLTEGCLFIPFQLSNSFCSISVSVRFHVIRNLPREVIVGNDYMDGHADIRNSTRSIFLYKHNQEIPFADEAPTSSVYCLRDVVLKPGAVTKVPIDFRGQGRWVLSDVGHPQAFVVDGVVDRSTSWILMVNKSKEELEMSKGERIPAAVLCWDHLLTVDAAEILPTEERSVRGVENESNVNPNASEEAKRILREAIERANEHFKKSPWGTQRLSHRILLKEEFVNRCAAYVYGPKEKDFIKESVQEMLAKGICQPSREPNVSPVVVAHHPRTKKMRFCVNYQRLNNVTKKEQRVMPAVWRSLQLLGGSEWFSSIDLQSGFWQIPIDERDRHLTAFICNEGIFEYLFMPFGLCSAPFTFQSLMEEVLGEMNNRSCFAYLDDVGMFTKGSDVEHAKVVARVIEKLVEANLRPNWGKCKFLYQEMDFFGHIVSKEGVRVNPNRFERLEAIKDLKNTHEVRHFLGLMLVYYRFIEKFSELAEPLNRLLRKGVEWRWADEEREAVAKLKASLFKNVVLAVPRDDKPFVVQVDASQVAAGYCVYQEIEGEQKVIAFGGKTFDKHQRAYGPGHREMYAIYLALREFRWCVYGREVKVLTDHESWTWVNAVRKNPPKAVAAWIMDLMDYNAQIEWIPGKFNTVADVLSRLWGSEDNIYFMGLIDGNAWTKEKREAVIREMHGGEMFGSHQAAQKTYEKMRDRYIWRGMHKDVKRICESCSECLVNKDKRKKNKLIPISATKPWNIVGVDVVGPFPRSHTHDFRYILIVVDYFSKWVELFKLKTATASVICQLLETKVFARHGCPQLVVSDGARVFDSCTEFETLLKRNGVSHQFSSAYHQQANGQVEAYVRLFKPILRIKCHNNVDEWPKKLDFVMASLNSSTSNSTGHSPYYALHGFEPRTPIEAVSQYEEVEAEAKKRFEAISERIAESKEVQQQQYNSNLTENLRLKPGDVVYVKKFRRENDLDVKFEPKVVQSERTEDGYIVSDLDGSGPQNVNVGDIKVDTTGDDLIGRRVRVYWPEYERNYDGVVQKTDDPALGTHIVKYRDGEFYENLDNSNKSVDAVVSDYSLVPELHNVSGNPSPYAKLVDDSSLSESEDDSSFDSFDESDDTIDSEEDLI
jgi:hypothetical protein